MAKTSLMSEPISLDIQKISFEKKSDRAVLILKSNS
jgi:hypothetical protein